MSLVQLFLALLGLVLLWVVLLSVLYLAGHVQTFSLGMNASSSSSRICSLLWLRMMKGNSRCCFSSPQQAGITSSR